MIFFFFFFGQLIRVQTFNPKKMPLIVPFSCECTHIYKFIVHRCGIFILFFTEWQGDTLDELADGKAWWFCGWIGMCVSRRSIEFWWRSVPLWPKTVITTVTNWIWEEGYIFNVWIASQPASLRCSKDGATHFSPTAINQHGALCNALYTCPLSLGEHLHEMLTCLFS